MEKQSFGDIKYLERGSSPQTLVCVHGLTRSGEDFLALAEALAEQRQVLCPDIVGRGDSAWLSDPKTYGMTRYVRDIETLLDHLDTGPVDWVGTSMGGLIGLCLATEHPGRIRRLILNDVGPDLAPAGLARILSYLAKPFHFASWAQAEQHHREIYAPFGALNSAQWSQLATGVLRPHPEGGYRYGYDPGIVFGQPLLPAELWRRWEALTCPVLILHGADSDVLSSSTAEEMLRRNASASLVEVPKRGHAPPLMDPGEIETVRRFLTD